MKTEKLNGKIEIKSSNGKSFVHEQFATYPIKFICLEEGNYIWIYVLSFGGGIVSGDKVYNTFLLDGGKAVVTTQGSTKVYKEAQYQENISHQIIEYFVENDSLLVVSPGPVVCFENSSFTQQQRFLMDTSSSVFFLDWFASGRYEDEHWTLDFFNSQNELLIDSSLVYFDNIELDSRLYSKDKTAIRKTMNNVKVFANVVFCGSFFLTHKFEEVQRLLSRKEILVDNKILVSQGEILKDEKIVGYVFRYAAEEIESIRNLLRKDFLFLEGEIGGDPFDT
eukprot:snap_masked-scaffold_35-processed-gene-2.46-mRNA-1 protein AED:1.00 eAED:1.00 QI:0/-1/0/0/-1/1/1/0/279